MSSEREQALAVRVAWMSAMGLSQEEIREYSNTDLYPINPQDEQAQLDAVQRLQAIQFTSEELSRLAQGGGDR